MGWDARVEKGKEGVSQGDGSEVLGCGRPGSMVPGRSG